MMVLLIMVDNSLLPDEEKRRALHGEYARRKVMARLGAASPSLPITPIPPPASIPTTSDETSTPMDGPSRNAQRAAENKKKLSGQDKPRRKQGPQGITQFEGKEAVALKRDGAGLFPASGTTTTAGSTSSPQATPTLEEIAAAAREKRRQEAKAAGIVAAAEAKAAVEAAAVAAKAEAAAAAAAIAAASTPKPSTPKEDEKLSIVAPKPKAPAKGTAASTPPPGISVSSSPRPPPSASPSPPLPSADGSTSGPSGWSASTKVMRPLATGLPSPADLDTILIAIGQLAIGQMAKHRFEFMGMLLLQCTFALTERHGDLLRGAGAQFHPSSTVRSQMAMEVRKLGASSILDFSPLSKLGVASQSVQLLGRVASMHQKSGADAALQEWMTQALATISSNDLFILYEYLHTLLQAMSSPSHADVTRMVNDEAKRLAAHGPEPPLLLGTSAPPATGGKGKKGAKSSSTASTTNDSKRSTSDSKTSEWPSLPLTSSASSNTVAGGKRAAAPTATSAAAAAAAQLQADEAYARSLDQSGGTSSNESGKKGGKGKGKTLLFRFGGM
jgi:hypothetical protein